MPGPELLLAFLTATAVFAYVPGPAMLYATARTLAGGRWSGLMAALGIHLGGYAHVLAAAAGPEGVGARRARCREAALLALRAACLRLREEARGGPPPSLPALSQWEALGALGAQALAGPAPEQSPPSERAAALGLVGDALEGAGQRDPGALLEAALAAAPHLPEPEARRLVRLASERHAGLLSMTLSEAAGDGDRRCRALATAAATRSTAARCAARGRRRRRPSCGYARRPCGVCGGGIGSESGSAA